MTSRRLRPLRGSTKMLQPIPARELRGKGWLQCAAWPASSRLTPMRIFEDLRGLGYAGGYDAVRRYAATWRRRENAATASAFVPLSFAPGEAFQFDWSHEIVLLKGVTTIVTSGTLDAPWFCAKPSQSKQENF